MDPARSPIFVIGTGRSGTTLIRFMLSAHPRIYITHEASFYVFEAIYSRRGSGREFLEYFFQTPAFRWLRLDPDRVRVVLPDPLPRERLHEIFTAVMREKAGQYRRVRWGDKTPVHATYLGRIFADYPDARVIHMVRDPRAVAHSLSRMPWASGSLFANAWLIERDHRKVAPYRDRVLRIRLEDLLAEPRATMARVLDYIGEPWDDAVLDHPRHIPDSNDMPPFPWLENSARQRAVTAAAWMSLSPVEVRLIERHASRAMEDGYAPTPLDREPSRLAVWWEGVRQRPQWLRNLSLYVKLGLMARDPRNFDGNMTPVWKQINPPAWAHYPGFEWPNPPTFSQKV